MNRQEVDSSAIFHDSFGAMNQLVIASPEQRAWIDELTEDFDRALISYAQRYVGEYDALRDKFKSGGKLSVNEAQRLAAVEACGLLISPILPQFGATVDVVDVTARHLFLSRRTLEVSGNFHEPGEHRLHIASGVVWREVFGFSTQVDVSNIHALGQELSILQRLNYKHWDEYVRQNNQRLSEVARRRFIPGKVYAFDPSPDLLIEYSLLESEVPLEAPHVNAARQTLADFLNSEQAKERYDTIFWRRVEPNIFHGNITQSSDLFDEGFDGPKNTTVKNSRRAAKFMVDTNSKVAEILFKTVSLLKPGGQLYLSVGTGNNPSESRQRAAFMVQVIQLCSVFKIPFYKQSSLEAERLDPVFNDDIYIELDKIVITRPDNLVSNDTKPEKKEQFKNIGRNDPCPCGSGKKFKHCHLEK